MKAFARMIKLSNIQGRADYITDEKRQENILAVSESVNWKPYQSYERENPKSNVRNNEGREIIIALPNEWVKDVDLSVKAQTIASVAIEKNTDMQWAVHWNKEHTNLHMHVVFSERKKTDGLKRYDRDVYLTEDGKVAQRKADRVRDKNGNIKPPIYQKGDFKGGFSAKDTRYKSKAWLHEMKANVRQVMERYGATIEQNDPLKQYHHGKGTEAPKIIEKNVIIKQANEQIKAYATDGRNPEKIIRMMKETLKTRNFSELATQVESIKSTLEQQRHSDRRAAVKLPVNFDPEKMGKEMGQLRGRYIREYQEIGSIREKHSDLARKISHTASKMDGISRDLSTIEGYEKKIDQLQEQRKSLSVFQGKQKKLIDQNIESVKQSLATHTAFFEREYQTTVGRVSEKLEEYEQNLSAIEATARKLPSAGELHDREKVLKGLEMQYKQLKVYADISPEHERRAIKCAEDKIVEQSKSEQGAMLRYRAMTKLIHITVEEYQQIRESMLPATRAMFDQRDGTKTAPSYTHAQELHDRSLGRSR